MALLSWVPHSETTHTTPLCWRMEGERGGARLDQRHTGTSCAGLRDTSGHTLKTEAPTAGTAPSPQLLTLQKMPLLWPARRHPNVECTYPSPSPPVSVSFKRESETLSLTQKTGGWWRRLWQAILYPHTSQGKEGARDEVSMDSGFFVEFPPLPPQLCREAW